MLYCVYQARPAIPCIHLVIWLYKCPPDSYALKPGRVNKTVAVWVHPRPWGLPRLLVIAALIWTHLYYNSLRHLVCFKLDRPNSNGLHIALLQGLALSIPIHQAKQTRYCKTIAWLISKNTHYEDGHGMTHIEAFKKRTGLDYILVRFGLGFGLY